MEINKILIVDDEKPIHTYLQRKLSKLGYYVFIAKDGEEALAQAFSHLPDIILLDIKMPKLNGIDVCKRLKSDDRTKHIHILMLSAKAQSEEIEEGMKAGADKYLCKPISFPDILKEIQIYEEDKSSSL